jgi:hypothetical protein
MDAMPRTADAPSDETPPPLRGTAQALLRIANAHPARPPMRWRIGLGTFGLMVFCTAVVLIPTVGLLVAYEPGSSLEFTQVVQESASRAPYLLSAGLAVLGATIYADWRNRRELGFRLTDEFNGDAMLAARRLLMGRMRAADGRSDLEDVRGWFPTGDLPFGEGPEDATEFAAGHSLYRVAVFAYRVREYDAERMLDHTGAVALLRQPFSHYEIVLLELAAALKTERRRLVAEGFAFDARWDAMATGIEDFFRIFGLAGRLPEAHRFWFFPSLNPVDGAGSER